MTMRQIVESHQKAIQESRAASLLNLGRKKLAEVNEQLTWQGVMEAEADLANEAVLATIKLVYQMDSDGMLCNADPYTGRISSRIAVAWGRNGYQYFPLTRHQSRILNEYMRQLDSDHDNPLFFYFRRGWYVNVRQWPSYGRATGFWNSHQITLSAWRHTRRVVFGPEM